MKGITPIIAIIVLLLITVAMAGAAWTYLSTYMQGLTGKSIELRDSFCVGGDDAALIIANTGTSAILSTEITVIDAGTGAAAAGSLMDPQTSNPITEIAPNGLGMYQTSGDICGTSCTLRVVGGTARAQTATVNC